jgi:hypothetical protein
MKRFFTAGLVSPAALFLVFGTAAVAYGQKEQEKAARPEKPQQEQKQQAKPEQKAPAQRAQQEPKQQAKPTTQRARQEPKEQAKPAAQRAQQEPKQQAKPAAQRAQQEPKQQAKPAAQRAQQEPKQQAKPPAQRAQQEPKQQAKPTTQRATRESKPAAKPVRQAQSNPSRGANAVPQRTQAQARGWQQQRGWLQQGGGWQGNSSWQQDRASEWQSQHRTWAERGGYGGYYIPDATFALDFGDQHWFRISGQPTIVGGFPRFRQDGFWFMMVDPYPESWAVDWYATDDVYVGYNNGYYLYNRRDPGDAIAISIVL